MSAQYEEVWKQIKEYPNYEISNFGYVRNIKTQIILKDRLRGKKTTQYKSVRLYTGLGSDNLSTHRLVAQYFVENQNPELFQQVHHIDNNKLNNHFTNLKWVNNQENCCMREKFQNKEYSSKYKGVYKRPDGFFVQVAKDGIKYYVGLFKDEIFAAQQYDIKAKELFGDNIKTNF